MKYKKLLDKIINDTSVSELEQYVSGEKKFTLRMTTSEHRKELLEIIIPKLIRKEYKDIQIEVEEWTKSAILRLARVRCRQKKLNLQDPKYTDTEETKHKIDTYINYHLTEAMRETINQIGKDTRSDILKRLFTNYSKHVKAGHYETEDF